MSLLDKLPHLVDIYALTTTGNDELIGGDNKVRTLKAGGSAVEAWVQTAGQAEIEKFEKRGYAVTHKIYFTTDPGFAAADTIIYNGSFFQFRSVADASAGLDVLFKAMFEEISSEQYLAP